MIKLEVIVKDGNVLDSFKKKDTNIEEVGVALLRLKHIEKQLLAIEFDSDFEVVG